MPISAPGRNRRRSPSGFTSSWRSAQQGFTSSWRSAQQGFTLVELLVVLFIVGLLSAAVVLAMPDPRGSVKADAERFAARAKAAQDLAILEARPIAVRVTGGGYGFERRAQGEWQRLERKPFTVYRWGKDIQALVPQDGARLVFDPTGLADPAEIVIARDGERATIGFGYDGKIDVAE